MQISNVSDVAGAPAAARVTYEDGTAQTVPRSQLPPELQLQNSGATAQASPVGFEDIAAKYVPPTAPHQVQDFQVHPPAGRAPESPTPQAPEFQAPQAPVDPRMAEISDLRSPYKYVAGTAAFDPRKEAARRVAVPVSQAVQTSGARAYDPEALQEAQAKERQAAEMQADSAMIQANAKLQADQLMHSEVSNAYRQQQAEQRAAEAEFNDRQASLDSEAKSIASREIDPNRAFKNMSVFQTLGLAIAAAFKGAATQGRDNSILESLMHRADADIRAQEFDIQNAKGRVDNALSRLSHQFGGIQAGKAALKDMQMSVMRAKIQSTASEVGTAVAKSNSDSLLARLDAEQLKLREQRWSEAQGQQSTSETSAMMSPRAGSTGGIARKSSSEMVRDWKASDDLEGSAITNEGKTLANIEKRNEIVGEKLDTATGGRKEHLGQALGEMANLRTSIDEIMSRGGITEDEKGNAKHGEIPGVGMGYNVVSQIPVFGEQLAALAASYSGPDAVTVRTKTQEALTAKIKEASGAAFSEKEAERHARALGQSFMAGEDQFAQAMVDFRHAIDAKEQSLRAGAGSAASRSFDADRGKLQNEAAASKVGIKGTYRGTVAK